MNFPGSSGLTGHGPPPDPNDEQMKKLKSFGESCAAKTVMSGVAGLGLGAVFGLFMASMQYDTPYHSPAPSEGAKAPTPKPPHAAGTGMVLPRANYGPPITTTMLPGGTVPLPMRQQIAAGFRDMGARSVSTGKNFGKVGAMFSGIECGIEGLRAKNDAGNGVAAGCVTGAILARNGGPQAAAIGCAGFAAFSAAIEMWLRTPKDE